jgi:DNA-directed RNA polymerase specialized sigma subunit
MSSNDNFVQEYEGMVRQIASEYHRKYPMVEKADLEQEIWLWFVQHPRKMEEWTTNHESKDSDKLIARSLRNASHDYCIKEKARVEGYAPDDVFFYKKEFIKMMIPAVLSDDWQKIENSMANMGRTMKAPSESGDFMAYAADIKKAFEELDETEQNLVFLFYGEDVDSKTLHDMVNNERPTARATAMAANRSLNKMVRKLGGFAPQKDNDYVEQKVEETDVRDENQSLDRISELT